MRVNGLPVTRPHTAESSQAATLRLRFLAFFRSSFAIPLSSSFFDTAISPFASF
jgi:hypothetical protein